MLNKDSKPSYTKDDPMFIDDPNTEVDDSIELNFARILEKENVIHKTPGKRLRSIAEASQDTGSGVYFE